MRTFLTLPFLLTGCAAGVSAEGVPGGFGLGMSAAYLRVDYGETDSESILISTELGVCDKYATFAEAQVEFLEAAMDVLAADYCEDMEEPFTAYLDAAQALFPQGARFVQLGVDKPKLDDGTFDMPEEAWGSVGVVTDALFQDARDNFDPDSDVTEGCGLDDDDLDSDFGDSWTLEGKLDLTDVGSDGPATGTVDAEMIDDDGDEDGAFTANFTATLCEIDI